MQERQVTIDGETHLLAPLPRPRDPEPDRVRGYLPAPRGAARPLPPPIRIGYLSREDELEALGAAPSAARTRSSSSRFLTRSRSSRSSARSRTSTRPGVGRPLHGRPRRSHPRNPRVQVGASLMRHSRAPEARTLPGRPLGPRLRDARRREATAVPALAHRLTLRPEVWVQQIRQDDVVGECPETVPTPAAEDLEPVSE